MPGVEVPPVVELSLTCRSLGQSASAEASPGIMRLNATHLLWVPYVSEAG